MFPKRLNAADVWRSMTYPSESVNHVTLFRCSARRSLPSFSWCCTSAPDWSPKACFTSLLERKTEFWGFYSRCYDVFESQSPQRLKRNDGTCCSGKVLTTSCRSRMRKFILTYFRFLPSQFKKTKTIKKPSPSLSSWTWWAIFPEPQRPWISLLTRECGSSSSHIQQRVFFFRGCRPQQGCRDSDTAWPLCYQALGGPAGLAPCPAWDTPLCVRPPSARLTPVNCGSFPLSFLLLLFSLTLRGTLLSSQQTQVARPTFSCCTQDYHVAKKWPVVDFYLPFNIVCQTCFVKRGLVKMSYIILYYYIPYSS